MAVSGNPDFNALSDAEQRVVAERLLKIKESNWRPFWCSDRDCTSGNPHPLLADGAPTLVSDTEIAGPNGEPVMDLYETADTGRLYCVPDPTNAGPHDTHLGRAVVDPAWAHNHARADQRLPGWLKPWVLFIMSGRGSGKTRTGVEFVTLCARKGLDGAILGRRGTELVNTHVAEIIANAHPEFVPVHYASKDILVWPNGATTYLFSAEKPENIRSVNLSYAWVDEAAFMDEIKTAWMNLRLATRKKVPGNPNHILITSTPTPTEWTMNMEDDEEVMVRRVSTYANRANLDADYVRMLEREYEGTRMGRQELHGEVLRDVEGALWNDSLYIHKRATPAEFTEWLETMDEVVVAVDPAGSSNKRSDLTGIIAVGVVRTDDAGRDLPAPLFYVLADGTLKGTPSEWAERTYRIANLVGADRIIAEKNFGGEMVSQVLRDYEKLNPSVAHDFNGESFRIEVVHAVDSKDTRAESTVGKYEQGRVTHITSPNVIGRDTVGDLSALEKEQTTWIPKSRGGKSPSPNRVDAIVWAVRALDAGSRYKGKVASSSLADSVMRHARGKSRGVTAPAGHLDLSQTTPRNLTAIEPQTGGQTSTETSTGPKWERPLTPSQKAKRPVFPVGKPPGVKKVS